MNAAGIRPKKINADEPKVFLGEYASWGNTYYSVFVEAAFMTGLEKNAHAVGLACYTPMLCNIDYGAFALETDLCSIRFWDFKLVNIDSGETKDFDGLSAELSHTQEDRQRGTLKRTLDLEN